MCEQGLFFTLLIYWKTCAFRFRLALQGMWSCQAASGTSGNRTGHRSSVICPAGDPVWKGDTLPQHLMAPLACRTLIHCLFNPAERSLRQQWDSEGSGSTLWCGGVAFLGPRVSYLIAHRPSPKILPISLTHRTDRCFQFVGRRLARPSKLPV